MSNTTTIPEEISLERLRFEKKSIILLISNSLKQITEGISKINKNISSALEVDAKIQSYILSAIEEKKQEDKQQQELGKQYDGQEQNE